MKLNIRMKIITGFAAIVIAMFAMNILIDVIYDRRQSEGIHIAERYREATSLAVNFVVMIDDQEAALRIYIANGNSQSLADYEKSMLVLQDNLVLLESLVADDQATMVIIRDEIRPTLNALKTTAGISQLGSYQARERLATQQYEVLHKASNKLLIHIRSNYERASKDLINALHRAHSVSQSANYILALMGVVLGYFIARRLTSSLAKVLTGIRRVKAGDYSLIGSVGTNDEVAEIATAVDRLVTMVQRQHADLEMQNEELQAQSEELTAQNEELLSQQEEIHSTMVKLSAQEDTLQRLCRFSQSLTQTIDHEELCKVIFNRMLNEAGAQIGAVFLYCKDTEELSIKLSVGMTVNQSKTYRIGDGLIGKAALEKQTVSVSYPAGQLRTDGLHGELALASEIYLPILFKTELLGVVVLGRMDDDAFNSDEKQLLQTLSEQAAIALKNAMAHLQTQEALVQTQEIDRLKSELLNTVSHELRTPLASILGFSELLLKKTPSPVKTQKYLDTIYHEAVRLTSLINNFLDLQRIESGRLEFTKTLIDIGDLIQHCVEVYKGQSAQHRIEVAIQDNLPSVWADPDRISQVFGNLLSNAIKYSPNGGVVEIRAELASDAVVVKVRDQGLGIPQDAQKDLFNPFFRVDNSDRRKIGGTGLGLAISQKIIRSHGGEIFVRSIHGQGSTFSFMLPIEKQGNIEIECFPLRTEGSGKNQENQDLIIVVEDDSAMADLLVDVLSENGYVVKAFADGTSALAAMRQHPPALVVLDITLIGRLTGWDVLRELKKNPDSCNIPVIISSSSDKMELGNRLGAYSYFVKPFPVEKLVESIKMLTKVDAGHVGVPRPPSKEKMEEAIQELLEEKGFAVQEMTNQDELLLITLKIPHSTINSEVV